MPFQSTPFPPTVQQSWQIQPSKAIEPAPGYCRTAQQESAAIAVPSQGTTFTLPSLMAHGTEPSIGGFSGQSWNQPATPNVCTVIEKVTSTVAAIGSISGNKPSYSSSVTAN
eukprot:gene16250-231_t